MAERLVESLEIDRNQRGSDRGFTVAVVALACLSLGIQVVAGLSFPFEMPVEISPRLSTRPTFTGSSQSYALRPGSAVFWRGNVWVSAPAWPPATSSRLVTIDPKSGAVIDTGMTLPAAPIGMVVLDEELYAVANSVVYRIADDQILPRSPRRALIHPTAPFVYQDRVAVIDRNVDDESVLLSWNNGEWETAGQVQIPGSPSDPSPANPTYSELRVATNEESTFVFFADWVTVYQREGLPIVPSQDAVSALRPVNRRPVYLEGSVGGTNSSSTHSRNFLGWPTLPNGFNALVPFQTMLIGNQLWAAMVPTPNSGLNLYQFEGGQWVIKFVKPGISLRSFSVVTRLRNYLVADDLRLYLFDDPTTPQLIGSQMLASQTILKPQRQQAVALIIWFWRCVLPAALLGWGVSWLMHRTRSSQYIYGHRRTVYASISRRGCARAIDTVILAYPSCVWLSKAFRIDSRTLAGTSERGAADVILIVFAGVFGLWTTSLLAISIVEGLWGVTPGKWLCGIRTLRTTLRPCGVVRALARELLIYVDSLMLLVWQPGILLIALTKHRQRLGDLAADTVVVLKPDRSSWDV